MMIKARCECGDMMFEAGRAPVMQLVCHCVNCRQATGRDYTVLAFFNVRSVSVSGPLSEQAFTAGSGAGTVRQACASCGTVMFDKSAAFPALIGVVAQTIEAPFEAEPTCHMWVSSKLPHVRIDDGLPVFSEGVRLGDP